MSVLELILGVAGGIVLGVYALRALARFAEWRAIPSHLRGHKIRMVQLTAEGQAREQRRSIIWKVALAALGETAVGLLLGRTAAGVVLFVWCMLGMPTSWRDI